MKPYPLRAGTGRTLAKLVQDYGNFPVWQPGGEAQKPDQVRMELVERWDQELFSDMRQSVPTEDKVLPVADWLIVVAGPERLKEVESFINIFAASIPQIEIEAKIVEIVVTDTLDLGIAPINETTPIFGFPDSAFVKSFNYNLPNSAGSGLGAINTFLTLGGVQDGFAFNAVLQALASYENVSIVSSPKIAVREGVRAQFVNTLKIPSLNVTGLAPDGRYIAGIVYDEVGIKLYVIPRVVGTQTVGLNIDIEASAQAGTAVTLVVRDPNDPSAPGQTISNPIISRRAAQTVVYLEPGQAVILGGLVSERTVDQENKVPLLGDIPIVGYLFKSMRKRKEKTNVLFFIRPRILQGTDLNREF
jgi:general secretion pathway protein D